MAILVTEAGMDLNAIKEGKKVLLIKKMDDLVVSFGSLLESDGLDASVDEEDDRIALAYSDYLKFLLFAKLLSNSGADKIYQRTADVIQVNLLHQGKEDEGYQLQNAYCYFKMKCSIEVDPTMMGSTLLRDLEGNPYMQTDWRSFEYTCIRGY